MECEELVINIMYMEQVRRAGDESNQKVNDGSGQVEAQEHPVMTVAIITMMPLFSLSSIPLSSSLLPPSLPLSQPR